jgi:murein L,D-transpeptidase YafK
MKLSECPSPRIGSIASSQIALMRDSVLHTLLATFAVSLPVLIGGCAPPEPAPTAAVQPAPAKPTLADRVVVLKSERLLELQHDGKTFETFPIALGAHSRGPKRAAGDGRTPEGVYRIDRRSEQTPYTRELHISYPNAQDSARARETHIEPGGGIFIHGLPRDYGPYDPPKWVKDWTAGCVAVGNAAIVKIWDAVPDGTPIDILP